MNHNCTIYEFNFVLFGPCTRQPFSSKMIGKEAWQSFMCDFKRGMLGCALLQRWHRSSLARIPSSCIDAFPKFSTSLITSITSRKNSVLKEFQCFLCFKHCELKSWLITWRCNCLIDGTCFTEQRTKNRLRSSLGLVVSPSIPQKVSHIPLWYIHSFFWKATRHPIHSTNYQSHPYKSHFFSLLF